MRKSALRCLGMFGMMACIAVRAAWAGEPVVGVDVGAAIPISGFRKTADVGGVIAPFAGYQFGNKIAFTPLVQSHFAAFGTAVDEREESEITSIFGITGGGRLSLHDEHREVYVSAQGGYYSDITGPINDKGDGFSLGGGFNYEFQPGTALGLFLRRDQTSLRAARGSLEDLSYVMGGLSLQHRFQPPAPAPVVAQAPAAPVPPAPPVQKKIVLRGVNFDFDKAAIRADARPILDEAARVLKEESAIAVVVEGHTDAMGTEAYNQGLSVRRAGAVRDYLAAQGIDRGRMTVTGFGEMKPVASNDTGEGRAQNRRVALRIMQ